MPPGMSPLTDPSRYVGRSVVYVNGARCVPARVVAVGSGGILIDTAEGTRLIAPSDIGRIEATARSGDPTADAPEIQFSISED